METRGRNADENQSSLELTEARKVCITLGRGRNHRADTTQNLLHATSYEMGCLKQAYGFRTVA